MDWTFKDNYWDKVTEYILQQKERRSMHKVVSIVEPAQDGTISMGEMPEGRLSLYVSDSASCKNTSSYTGHLIIRLGERVINLTRPEINCFWNWSGNTKRVRLLPVGTKVTLEVIS